MVNRRLLFFSGLAVIGCVACSSGGGVQPIPMQQPLSRIPAVAQALPATVTHYLYAAAGNRVDVYALPLTATSKPVHSITGLSSAENVAVSASNIMVADNGANKVDYFFRTGTSALKLRCSFAVNEAYGLAVHSTALYATQFGIPGILYMYPNGNISGTPAPCGGETPVSTGAFQAGPVAADKTFVYLGEDNAEGSTLLAYAQPLTANEVPNITLNVSSFNPITLMVVTNTDLYLSEESALGAGILLDFTLPFSTKSKVIAIQLPVCTGILHAQPRGIAVYPAVTSSLSKPTKIFVSDTCSNNIYTYALPLTTTSTPKVTTPAFAEALAAR